MLVKILGGIDVLSSITLLMFIFGLEPYNSLIVFCASLLLVKGMFIFSGDLLSLVDILSGITLLISIFFAMPVIILWIFSLLLMAKAVASFI